MGLSTKAERGACSIHRHITAADYDCLFALRHGSCIILQSSLHQVASGQVLIGRKYTVGILSGNTHEHGKSGTGADEYGIKALFIQKLVHSHRLADDHICLNLYAQRLHILNLGPYNCVLGKTEFRNSVCKHAAGLMKSFKDGHIIAPLSQVAGTGKSCRTGSDHSNLLAV